MFPWLWTFSSSTRFLSRHSEFEDLFHDSFKLEEPENEDCGCFAQSNVEITGNFGL